MILNKREIAVLKKLNKVTNVYSKPIPQTDYYDAKPLSHKKLNSLFSKITSDPIKILEGLSPKYVQKVQHTRINPLSKAVSTTYVEYSVSQDGLMYLQDLAERTTNKVIEWIRYGITTAIASGALIVAIIAISVS